MTQEQIDAIILDFLKAYKAWADEDAPEGSCFDRVCGLCSNLEYYVMGLPYTLELTSFEAVQHFSKILPSSSIIPFETRSRTYIDDARNNSHHRNPARMAWVNEQIERMEK